jgi:iron complex transport system ATP-binding protein
MGEITATAGAVSFEDLGHAYRPGRWVFRHYNAIIEGAHIFALLGPNGRGKTTLLKTLLGVLKPAEGAVHLGGRAAFVPQLFQVGFDYSVLDMVLMGRARRIGLFGQPSRQDVEISLAALARFGLADRAADPFHELSGGQRQMVIFARGLVAQADILILDEPTASLDLKHQVLVLDWILRLSREDGLTVIFTTHYPNHALAVADSALLMFGEHDFVCGPGRDVLTESNLQRLYEVPVVRLSGESKGRRLESFTPILPARGSSGSCRPEPTSDR